MALAPALRRRPALEELILQDNPLGDEGLAALVAPPPPAGALPPTGVLTKLKQFWLIGTQITDAGCAALVAALDSGALPALEKVYLDGTPQPAPRQRPLCRHWQPLEPRSPDDTRHTFTRLHSALSGRKCSHKIHK